MKKCILFCFALFMNIQSAIAGGFSWSCESEKFSAHWNGKPFRPLSDEIDLTYLPENFDFMTKLISTEETDGKQIFNFVNFFFFLGKFF